MRSQFTRSRHNRQADQRLIRGNFGLKVSGDGRAAALDLRLALDEDLWQAMGEDLVLATEVGMTLEIPGKISVAAERIHAIWETHRDDPYLAPDDSESPVRGSLQLVFCDIGTPF